MSRSSRWAAAVAVAVDLVWWLSLAGVAIAGVLLTVVAVHATRGGTLRLDFYFDLPPSAYRISSGQLGGAPAEVRVSSGQLGFAHPRLSFVLVSAAIFAVAAGWWLFVLHELRRLLAALRAGKTFDRQNAMRLRRIGFGVIGFELTRALVTWAGGLYLKHVVVARGINLRPHFGLDIPVILLGLLVLVLATAFAAGSDLAEEQALTV